MTYKPKTTQEDRAELYAAIPDDLTKALEEVFHDLDQAEAIVGRLPEVQNRLGSLVHCLREAEQALNYGGCLHPQFEWDFKNAPPGCAPLKRCTECGAPEIIEG